MKITIDKTSMVCLAFIASAYIVSKHISWFENLLGLAGNVGMKIIM